MAQQTQIRQSIELLRFVCALGIVWFHMHAPGERIAYSSLALFLILTAFLTVGSLDRGSERQFWVGRARRIALPWVAWSIFYLEVEMVRMQAPLDALRLENPLALLIGPTIHLWFLPFTLLASVVIARVRLAPGDADGLAGLTAGACVVSAGSLYLHSFVPLPDPFAQWSFAVPAVCYGVLSAEAKKQGTERVLGFFLAGVIAASLVTGAATGLLQLLIAVVLFEAFWRLDARRWPLQGIGRIAFGIYIIHPFFVLVYHKLFAGDGRTAAAVLCVFALSSLATVAMLRMPIMKALV